LEPKTVYLGIQMCYIAPFIFIYQCDLCPSTIRATISPTHICRFGYVHDPERALPDMQIDTNNPDAVCDGTFTPVPDTGDPPCTLTVKSHERCKYLKFPMSISSTSRQWGENVVPTT
jgi:hypothetical protein